MRVRSRYLEKREKDESFSTSSQIFLPQITLHFCLHSPLGEVCVTITCRTCSCLEATVPQVFVRTLYHVGSQVLRCFLCACVCVCMRACSRMRGCVSPIITEIRYIKCRREWSAPSYPRTETLATHISVYLLSLFELGGVLKVSFLPHLGLFL